MTTDADNESRKPADVIMFVDEAGFNGLIRNLKPEHDAEIGVMCALPVPSEHLAYVRNRVQPFYDAFCAAAPPGAKLHITDAFKPGNESWRPAAEYARDGIFQLMREIHLRVVYVARRAKLAREGYELRVSMKSMAGEKIYGPSRFKVKNANRPISDIFYEQLMTSTGIWIDGFMENAGFSLAEIHFDEIDKDLAKIYQDLIDETRNVSKNEKEVEARNMVTGQSEFRTMQFTIDAPFEINTTHIGDIIVAGKSDPMIFAADVVANSLWRHLKKLPDDAPLNVIKSLDGWELQSITFGDHSPNAGPSMLDII